MTHQPITRADLLEMHAFQDTWRRRLQALFSAIAADPGCMGHTKTLAELGAYLCNNWSNDHADEIDELIARLPATRRTHLKEIRS